MAQSTTNEDFFYAMESLRTLTQGDQVLLKASESRYDPFSIRAIEDPEYEIEFDFETEEEWSEYLDTHYSSMVEIELSITVLSHNKWGSNPPGNHTLYFVRNNETGDTQPIGPHNQFDPDDYNTDFISIEDILTPDEIKSGHGWNERGNSAANALSILAESTDLKSMIEIMAFPIFLDEDCQQLRFTYQTSLEDGSMVFNCIDLHHEQNEMRFQEIKEKIDQITEKLNEILKQFQ